jgi:uncharacterized Zn finger protein
MLKPPFAPGNPGGGRPRGARNKLARKFLEDALAAWERDGEAALKIMAKRDPVKFCQMMALIVPRELEFTANVVTELDDAALAETIAKVREQLERRQELALPSPKVIEHEHVQ